jgi:hypothetical protein
MSQNQSSLSVQQAPLDPSTPLVFDGEEISAPEPVIASRFFPDPDGLKEAFLLACDKTTRDMVDRGYRRFAARHGWVTDGTPFRAEIHASVRVHQARKAWMEENEAEKEIL